MKTSWGTPEAARLCGVKFRTVDYWARQGVVRPSVEARGIGSHRGYSFRDMLTLCAVAAVPTEDAKTRNMIVDSVRTWNEKRVTLPIELSRDVSIILKIRRMANELKKRVDVWEMKQRRAA